MRQATLVAARALSPSVRELTFDPGPDHHFVPGHWVTLYLDGVEESGETLKRQYSIASPPRADGTFDIAVTRVDGGPMSTCLHAIQPGESIRMLEAQGLFVLEPLVRPVLMVATGTGVAPFRSMLFDAFARAATMPPVALLFGNRTADDVLYREEWEALAARAPRFAFEPTLSRADDRWPGRRGWVQEHLAEQIGRLGTDLDVYICGLTKMVKDVRAICRERLGVDRKRIHVERYD